MSTVNILLNNVVIRNVDTVLVPDATNPSNTHEFVYGGTGTETADIKVGNNILENVNSLKFTNADTGSLVSFVKADSVAFIQIFPTRGGTWRYGSTTSYSRISNLKTDKYYTYKINVDDGKYSYSYGYLSYNGVSWEDTFISGVTSVSLSLFNQSSNQLDIIINHWGTQVKELSGIIVEGNTVMELSEFDNFTPTNNFVMYGCMAKGTKITLANGKTKKIEDITYDDDLLVWNFYEGKLDHAKPCWILSKQNAEFYWKIKLSDGTIINFVGPTDKCHRLFSLDAQQMLYATECVGHKVYKKDGSTPTLVSYEVIYEPVEYYNITTEKYLDYFVNNTLSGSRMNNMYHISNMKYDSNERLISEEEEIARWKARGMEKPEW